MTKRWKTGVSVAEAGESWFDEYGQMEWVSKIDANTNAPPLPGVTGLLDVAGDAYWDMRRAYVPASQPYVYQKDRGDTYFGHGYIHTDGTFELGATHPRLTNRFTRPVDAYGPKVRADFFSPTLPSSTVFTSGGSGSCTILGNGKCRVATGGGAGTTANWAQLRMPKVPWQAQGQYSCIFFLEIPYPEYLHVEFGVKDDTGLHFAKFDREEDVVIYPFSTITAGGGAENEIWCPAFHPIAHSNRRQFELKMNGGVMEFWMGDMAIDHPAQGTQRLVHTSNVNLPNPSLDLRPYVRISQRLTNLNKYVDISFIEADLFR